MILQHHLLAREDSFYQRFHEIFSATDFFSIFLANIPTNLILIVIKFIIIDVKIS